MASCAKFTTENKTYRAVKIACRNMFQSWKARANSRLQETGEAQILQSLNHPGIVKCIPWTLDLVHIYITLELHELGDLLNNLIQNGAFTEEQAQPVFQGIREAMTRLHQRKIAHRDLKPENVLLTDSCRASCRPILADLGLARISHSPQDLRTFCGTPHYMAPEVVRQKCRTRVKDTEHASGYGISADAWSLGKLLYVLLSGAFPFDENNLDEEILEARYHFHDPMWQTINHHTKALVAQLAEPDLALRMPTCETLDSAKLDVSHR